MAPRRFAVFRGLILRRRRRAVTHLKLILTLTLGASVGTSLHAQPTALPEGEPLESRVERLESQLTPLREEVLRLQVERTVPAEVSVEYFGQGPTMSKAYFSELPLSWGATAEYLFQIRDHASDDAGMTDLRLFLGYRLSSRLTFQSALALDSAPPGHESTPPQAEEDPSHSDPTPAPHLDFAIMDWRPHASSNSSLVARAGLLPAPIGERRLRPEPTLYADPFRSRVEEWILPFDLSRPGLAIMAETKVWHAQFGLIASPDATQLRSGTFLEGAGARFRPSRFDRMDRFSVVSRFEISWKEADEDRLNLVISAMSGDTNHNTAGLSTTTLSVAETHIRWRQRRLEWSALGALGHLRGASSLQGTLGTRPGSRARGWTSSLYAELTPEPLPAAWIEAGLFASLEGVELENGGLPNETVAMAMAGENRMSRATRVGLLAKPVPNVVVKLGRQWRLGSESIDADLWQLALAAVF